jgi:hypothetical protein
MVAMTDVERQRRYMRRLKARATAGDAARIRELEAANRELEERVERLQVMNAELRERLEAGGEGEVVA